MEGEGKGLTEVTVEMGSMAGMVVRGSTEVVEEEGMEEMEVILNLCVHAEELHPNNLRAEIYAEAEYNKLL